jgi:hypothetical protein
MASAAEAPELVGREFDRVNLGRQRVPVGDSVRNMPGVDPVDFVTVHRRHELLYDDLHGEVAENRRIGYPPPPAKPRRRCRGPTWVVPVQNYA